MYHFWVGVKYFINFIDTKFIRSQRKGRRGFYRYLMFIFIKVYFNCSKMLITKYKHLEYQLRIIIKITNFTIVSSRELSFNSYQFIYMSPLLYITQTKSK